VTSTERRARIDDVLSRPRRARIDDVLSRPRSRVALAVATFVVALIVTLLIGLPQGTDSHFYGGDADATADELIATLGGSDSGSYLSAADDLLDGSMSADNAWVLSIWPPGMPYLLAALIPITGDAPILGMVIVFAILSAAAAAAMMTLLARSLRGLIVGAAAVAFWLASPQFWALPTGWAVIGSDGIATCIAVIVVCTLFLAERQNVRRRRIALFIASGVGLAALAYLRTVWAVGIPIALAIVVLAALVVVAVRWLRSRRTFSPRSAPLVVGWIALAGVYAALCLPWTVYGATELHPGKITWSDADFQWAKSWMTDEYLEGEGSGFLAAGGANWPCEIDEATCEEIMERQLATESPYSGAAPQTFIYYRNLAFRVALGNPVEFVGNRTLITWESWMSTPGEPVGSYRSVGWGVVTLLAFVGSLVALIVRGFRGSATSLFVALLLGANLGILWLTHFETRYLIPLHAISLVVIADLLVRGRTGLRYSGPEPRAAASSDDPGAHVGAR
jgi:hypothetical protein